MANRRAELRAVKDWRPIENCPPKPVKKVAAWVRISRNHRLWKYPYSVEVKSGRYWGIFSQHRTVSGALDSAKRILRKYKSGVQALSEG